MISCSHWGMFRHDWPSDAAYAPDQWWRISFDFDGYDARYLHGTYQHLNFGPYLS